MGQTAQALAHRREAVAIFAEVGTTVPEELSALGPDVRLA
jgi:hypothetical protein